MFSKGPLRTLCATLRLEPDGESASVGHYTIEATPANLLGTLALASGLFFRAAERTFTGLAYQARDWAAGERATPFGGPPRKLTDAAAARIGAMVQGIEASGNGHGLAQRLVDWLLQGQEFDMMRIRPLALARQWGATEREVVELCLQAVSAGLLESRWDLLCPRCRGAKLTVTSLDRLPRDSHCASCNIDYGREFARNVELTFHPAPAVREVIDGEFCLFGPMTTPHVKVQLAVEPGQSRSLPVSLAPGAYRLRTLEIGGESHIDYQGGAFPTVRAEGGEVAPGELAEKGEISFVNREDRRRTFIVESRDWAEEALTAHRVTTMQAFRDLFGDDVLSADDEVGISQVTLMFTDLRASTAFYDRVGDATAYHLVRQHFSFLGKVVREHHGAIIKTMGDAIFAAFTEPADAVRAALAIQTGIKDFNAVSGAEDLVMKIGLHGGPCIAVTLNERLDYFGSTVNLTSRLERESEGGDIVLSEALASDPAVSSLLPLDQLKRETQMIRGFEAPVTFRRVPAEWASKRDVRAGA